MKQNRRPNPSSIRHKAALALALFIGTMTGQISVKAQDPPFVIPTPICYAYPSPETDTWPRAVTDSLGSTAGVPFTFPATALTANDTAAVTVLSVGPASSGGGTITGSGPFVFTPAPGFVGEAVFPYEIADATLRTTMGLAKISVTAVNNNTTTVPAVVGLLEAAAESSISGAGLVASVATANSTSAAIGTVISQNPQAGNTVANGSSVALVVSLGALVPNLVGSAQAAAAATITAAGLTVGTASGVNNAAPVNSVISQSLTAGSSVAPGTAMSYVYSLGVAVVLVPVPDVVNQTQANATAAITGASLTLGGVTTASSTTIASGNVISQNPAAGAMRAPGTAVSLVVSSGPPVVPPAPAGGLVLAFGFEEASGTAVIDSSAAPMNGTILGAVRTAAGKIGRALSFDGVNDWVTVTDTTASKIDLTNGLTVEAWVNPTAMAGWETVVMKERGAAGTGLLSYALYAHDGAPQAGTFAGPAAYLRMAPAASTTDQGIREASHTPLPLNAWTHIATTYDGANMRFYINGVLVATRAQTGNIAVGNQALRIGGNNMSGEFFKGLIDEVRIYNRALSAAEISADMTTPVMP